MVVKTWTRKAPMIKGPWGGPHAIGDMGAFKGRPRRARDTANLASDRQGYLCIGPDVYRQKGALSFPGLNCQQHGHVITSDKSGNIGQQMDIRARSHRK